MFKLKKIIIAIGYVVFVLSFSHSEISAEQFKSDAFSSMDFEEPLENEEEVDWMPESMNLDWDTSYVKYSHRQDHLLNPEERLFSFDDYKTQTSIDLEWNPEISGSLNFRSRQAIEYMTSDLDSATKWYLLEGYLQWENQAQDLIIDVGKIKLEWGSGYAWKPAQVLFPKDSGLSINNESQEGLEMVQMEVVIDHTTSTLLIAKKDNDTDLEDNSQRQAVFHLSLKFQPWEVSMLHHETTEEIKTTGLSFSGLLSDAWEIHGEWTRTNSRDRSTIIKASDGVKIGSIYLPARFEYQPAEVNENFDRFLFGTQYTFTNSVNIIIELYRTTHGYNDDEWGLIKTGISEAHRDNDWKNSGFNSVNGNPYVGFLRQTMGLLELDDLRQNYLFFRWTTGESDDLWEWEQIFKLNLDDQSHMSMGTLHKSWTDSIKTELSCNFFIGDAESEQELNPYNELCTLTISMGF